MDYAGHGGGSDAWKPSGTFTSLFTDIEGSTRIWEKHPEAIKPALARHDAILKNAIKENGGVVFKTVGDAFYSVFSDARNAIASIKIQLDLQAQSWGEAPGIKVRVALHSSEAERRSGDYLACRASPPRAMYRTAPLLSLWF